MSLSTYQNDFLAYLFGITEEEPVPNAAIYRRGVEAKAERALGLSYPTVRALLGQERFEELSIEYLQNHKKTSGDWFDFGREFGHWIGTRDIVETAPYLKDVAQLEWSLAIIERSDYSEVDVESFSLIAQDFADCKLVLNGSVRVFRSAYPVVSIWEAHQSSTPRETLSFAHAKRLLAKGLGQNVLVTRDGWRGLPEAISEQDMAWIEKLKARRRVSQLFDEDTLISARFSEWLQELIAKKVIIGVELSE